MRHCIELAKTALSQGNTPVGCVVVVDGQIVGEGIEALPTGTELTGHAEVLACQAAVNSTGRRRLEGAALYSTAEPCLMCSYVIRQCGIALVVFGKNTSDIGGVTSNLPVLTHTHLGNWMPPPDIVQGILRDECERLRVVNREY